GDGLVGPPGAGRWLPPGPPLACCLVVVCRRRCGTNGLVPEGLAGLRLTFVIVSRPIGAVVVALEVDHTRLRPFTQVAFAAQALGLLVFGLELAGPVAPDLAEAQIDEKPENDKNEN